MADIITLEELRNDMCKWPIGDPQEDDFRFCGCKRESGGSYCSNHQRLAYRKYVAKTSKAA